MERYENSAAGGYVQIPIADKTVTTELSGDFTLPDYQPEIKRLLRVTATVLPPSRYVGNHEAEFAGSVDYYVLYTGSDNEVYCAPLTAEYKVSVPMEQNGETPLANVSGSAVITPDLISGRVTSPRKLNIKCRLRTRARILGEMPLEEKLGLGDEGVEVLHGTAEVTRTLWATGERLQVSDEMISDNRDGELRVISAEGHPLMSEVTPVAGAVSCRGDLYLKLLLGREDGSAPYTALRKIPFTQTIPVEGADGGCSATAKGTVCEMSITVEDGKIGLDVGMLIECRVCADERIGYVKDLYSTARRTLCEYKEPGLPNHGAAFYGNFTLSDSVTAPEAGVVPDARILDVSGSVFPEEYGFEEGRCLLSGRARFSLLLEKDGELSVSDVELPFRYEVKSAGKAEGAICDAEVISVRARDDGERVGIDAEIGIRGEIWSLAETKMPSRIGFGDEILRTKGECVIAYPSRDDSLWSVAKRYGVSLSSLMEENRLNEVAEPDSKESLDGVPFLML